MEGVVVEAVVAAAHVVDDLTHIVELVGIFDDEGVRLVQIVFQCDVAVGNAVVSGGEFQHPHGVGAGENIAAIDIHTAADFFPEMVLVAATHGEIVVGRCPGLVGIEEDGHRRNS